MTEEKTYNAKNIVGCCVSEHFAEYTDKALEVVRKAEKI